jgi:1-acyl-sn-glycerol-3-phosphate acyltransferase
VEKRRNFLIGILMHLVGYAGYYLFNCLFLLISLPIMLCLSPFPTLRHAVTLGLTNGFAKWLTHVYLPLLGVIKIVNVSGIANCPQDQSFICVSNHLGRLDALLLTGFLKRTCVVIKAKHTRFPMLACLVRFCGYISVDPHSATNISEALQKCSSQLAQGFNVLVFPEGTRATGTRMRRFGKFAFEAAVKQGAPIVPVVIYSRTDFMAKSLASFFPHDRVDYHVAFLPTIYPGPDDTPSSISDIAYREMSRKLASLSGIHRGDRKNERAAHRQEGADHAFGIPVRER